MLNEQELHNDVVVQQKFNRSFTTYQLFKPYIIGKTNNGSAYNDQEEDPDKSISA